MAGYRDPAGLRDERVRELRDRIAAVQAETLALEAGRRSLQQEWRSVREIVRPGGWALVALWVATFMALLVLWSALDARRVVAPPAAPPRIERPLGEAHQARPRLQYSAAGWHLEHLSASGRGIEDWALGTATIACRSSGDLWIAAAGALTRRFPSGGREREAWRGGASWRSLHIGEDDAGLALTNDNEVMVRTVDGWDHVRLGGQRMEALWMDGRRRLWLAGGGRVAMLPAGLLSAAVAEQAELSPLDGINWSCLWPTKKPCSGLVRAVWGAGGDDVWIAGNDGILHWSHGRWSQGEPGGAFALWGTGPRDVWAVGRRGSIRHWNGTSWLETPVPAAADLHGVSGTASDDVWAVGDDWTVLWWDGTTWSPVTTPADMLAESSVGPLPDARTLNAVCAAGSHVFIVGEPDVLLHFDARR